MDNWLQMTLTVVCAVIASSGFWAYLQARREGKVGLAHDRILSLGMQYIERGHITRDEYENLYEYLYRPYEKMGGNGSAKRIMQIINTLPIQNGSA